eukprot:403332464
MADRKRSNARNAAQRKQDDTRSRQPRQNQQRPKTAGVREDSKQRNKGGINLVNQKNQPNHNRQISNNKLLKDQKGSQHPKDSEVAGGNRKESNLGRMQNDRKRVASNKRHFGDKNVQVPIHSVKLDFETFSANYKMFATLRNIVFSIHEKLLKRDKQQKQKDRSNNNIKQAKVQKPYQRNESRDYKMQPSIAAKQQQQLGDAKKNGAVVNIYLSQEDMEFDRDDSDDRDDERDDSFGCSDRDDDFSDSIDSDFERDSKEMLESSFFDRADFNPKSQTVQPKGYNQGFSDDESDNPLNDFNDRGDPYEEGSEFLNDSQIYPIHNPHLQNNSGDDDFQHEDQDNIDFEDLKFEVNIIESNNMQSNLKRTTDFEQTQQLNFNGMNHDQSLTQSQRMNLRYQQRNSLIENNNNEQANNNQQINLGSNDKQSANQWQSKSPNNIMSNNMNSNRNQDVSNRSHLGGQNLSRLNQDISFSARVGQKDQVIKLAGEEEDDGLQPDPEDEKLDELDTLMKIIHRVGDSTVKKDGHSLILNNGEALDLDMIKIEVANDEEEIIEKNNGNEAVDANGKTDVSNKNQEPKNITPKSGEKKKGKGIHKDPNNKKKNANCCCTIF